MKTKISYAFMLAAIFIFLNGFDAMAGKKKIHFVVSEPDAKIFVGGKCWGPDN